MKKAIISLAIVIMSALGVAALPTQNAYAVAGTCESHILGLPAWYDGLPMDSNCNIESPSSDEDLKSYVWTIVLNIVGLVTGLIGYLAIGFVMWGGIQYMIAQGDPGKVAKGKKTITNSVIGLVIAMSASILSGAIAGIISGAKGDADTGKDFFKNIFNKVFVWSGIVAVIMIVYGGIQYVTSAGNSAAVSKAKTTILYSIVGLLVVILAAAIVNVVVGAVTGE